MLVFGLKEEEGELEPGGGHIRNDWTLRAVRRSPMSRTTRIVTEFIFFIFVFNI